MVYLSDKDELPKLTKKDFLLMSLVADILFSLLERGLEFVLHLVSQQP
jgi:hypothetical protein